MKQASLFFLLLISGYSLSQQNDSVPKKKKAFENFFGCECCADTVTIDLAYKHKWVYECTLYKSQYLLIVRKKGKVMWKADFKADMEGKSLDYLCVFDGGSDQKGNERIILSNGSKRILVFYLKNGKRIN